ncbi:MAG: ATP-binding cassette domain-containing protein [Methylococcales bacterium]|nr:ATP-binding cassette domain-containing protein [Methylococcales bacterium]
MTDIHIDIKNKTYITADACQHTAIKDFKLSLTSNEFVCLVGPSGCGKTTLLNIIANLDSQYQGEISLAQQYTQPKIGYIFQNPRLLPWRTVRENIELALPVEQSSEIVDSLLDAMQLSNIQHVYPEHLSLGMSRRVSIIRAFAINPDVLLMDEPFVSLDAPTARQVRELLISLWQQRPHTILFVTHDLREAITLADRLVFLSPSPMTVISEIKVNIARENRDDELLIENFRQQLLTAHPEIKNLL